MDDRNDRISEMEAATKASRMRKSELAELQNRQVQQDSAA